MVTFRAIVAKTWPFSRGTGRITARRLLRFFRSVLMPRSGSHIVAGLVLLCCPLFVGASDDPKPAAPHPKTVEQVAEAARKSLAVITFAGRDGKRQGLGTGFVVGADGLIATNMHV